MSMLVAVFVGLCLYGMIRMLNLASPSLPPSIYSKTRNSEFIQAILSSCPILREPYVPPLLWGKSGHLQTVVYAKIGRMRDPVPNGVRHTKTLQDGSTLTFDLYQPTSSHRLNGDYFMLVCPGFGSSSESSYIRALVTHAQTCGYRVAVLNHLGSLFSLRLTAPRIFSYGGWEEFHIMRQEVEHLYPHCKLILVGLSMGANIVLKYLGENPRHQQNIWCALSICQGYNVNAAKDQLKQWQNLRRAYLYTMTANQRRLIKHHSEVLFTEEVRRRFNFDLKKIFSATTLEDLDLHFTCKLQGHQDIVEFYEQSSCSNYIGNIDVPLILLNSEDDPIVPHHLFKYARDYAVSHDHSAFITTRHGGHLGFFESGFIRPHSTSWIDRFVCQTANAVIAFKLHHELLHAGPSTHHFTMQVKKLSTLEPVTDTAEWEETADLSMGEGRPVNDKSGTSSEQELQVQTNSEEVSELSGQTRETVSLQSQESCGVTLPSDAVCSESVEGMPGRENLLQSKEESREAEHEKNKAYSQDELDLGLKSQENVLDMRRESVADQVEFSREDSEDDANLPGHQEEKELSKIEDKNEEDAGLCKEGGEDEVGINGDCIPDFDRDFADTMEEFSSEEKLVTSQQSLLQMSTSGHEDIETNTGSEAILKCGDKPEHDPTQESCLSKVSVQLSEELCTLVMREAAAQAASLEIKSESSEANLIPSNHSVSLDYSESQEEGVKEDKSLGQGETHQKTEGETAAQSSVETYSRENPRRLQQEAAGQAISCEAIELCSRLGQENQPAEHQARCLLDQPSPNDHFRKDTIVSRTADLEKKNSNVVVVNNASEQQNRTVATDSTNMDGSHTEGEMAATASLGILNMANSRSY